jgi:hypothetical protein
MPVDLDICNSALIKLGAERINDLTDPNNRAQLCNEQYPKIRRKILRSHPWNFAVERALLTPNAVVPAFTTNGENFFDLPADCIRILSINDCTPYFREGDYLITTLSEVKLTYISDAILDDLFDEDFKEAAACALAADLCYSLTQSNTLKQSLLQECEKWISEARSYNSQEVTVLGMQFDDWDSSRRLGEMTDADILTGPKV